MDERISWEICSSCVRSRSSVYQVWYYYSGTLTFSKYSKKFIDKLLQIISWSGQSFLVSEWAWAVHHLSKQGNAVCMRLCSWWWCGCCLDLQAKIQNKSIECFKLSVWNSIFTCTWFTELLLNMWCGICK